MSTEWYCPNCGPVTKVKIASLSFKECAACLSLVSSQIPPHVTAMQEEIATLQAENAKQKATLADIASMIRRLTHALRNNDNATMLRKQAMDFLNRTGLESTPMRGETDSGMYSEWYVAALQAELGRAREALISAGVSQDYDAWIDDHSGLPTMEKRNEYRCAFRDYAEARYKREIEQGEVK